MIRKIFISCLFVFVFSVLVMVSAGMGLYIGKLVYWFKSGNWQGVIVLLTMPMCFFSGLGAAIMCALDIYAD